MLKLSIGLIYDQIFRDDEVRLTIRCPEIWSLSPKVRTPREEQRASFIFFYLPQNIFIYFFIYMTCTFDIDLIRSMAFDNTEGLAGSLSTARCPLAIDDTRCLIPFLET